MIEITTSNGITTQIDDCDADLALLSWYGFKGNSRAIDRQYYIARNVKIQKTRKNRAELLHVVILERVLGRRLSDNEMTDHADTNPLNNRRDNLRVATRSQNAHNSKRRADNQSGYKGVVYRTDTKKFRASIRKDGKLYHLGYYNTAEEAHEAYCKAADELYGEYKNYG